METQFEAWLHFLCVIVTLRKVFSVHVVMDCVIKVKVIVTRVKVRYFVGLNKNLHILRLQIEGICLEYFV